MDVDEGGKRRRRILTTDFTRLAIQEATDNRVNPTISIHFDDCFERHIWDLFVEGRVSVTSEEEEEEE